MIALSNFSPPLALRNPSRNGTPTELQRQRYFYTEELLEEWEKDTFTLITDFLEHLCRGYFPSHRSGVLVIW